MALTDCKTFRGIQTAGNTQGLGFHFGLRREGYQTCLRHFLSAVGPLQANYNMAMHRQAAFKHSCAKLLLLLLRILQHALFMHHIARVLL